MIETKKCNKCNRILPITEFYKQIRKDRAKVEYRPRCKECEKEPNRQYQRKRFGWQKNQPRWTSEEDNILREFYYIIPNEDLLIKLPNRNWDSILSRVSMLNINIVNQLMNTSLFDKKRLEVCYENYSKKTINARLSNIEFSSSEEYIEKVKKLIFELSEPFVNPVVCVICLKEKVPPNITVGLNVCKQCTNDRLWSSEEIEILKNNNEIAPLDLLTLIPSRTWPQIRSKAGELGLEIGYLKSNTPVYNKKKRQNYYIKEYILDYLSNHPCTDCGSADIRVLEFDHLPQFKKSFNIGEKVTNGDFNEDFELELKKCEVVCSNCHKIRHAKRSNNYRQRFYEKKQQA
jgi:hypothetical protein